MIPARLKRLTTKQTWTELALDKRTITQLEKIKHLQNNSATITGSSVLKKKAKTGNRALFFGPSAAPKLATAALIGMELNKVVYKIDLSKIVSKYIGETEKNLEQLFTRAEGKEWILFFDEADALFGKRTEVKDSHDRYANQEIAYLLQRIENYDGLIMLASNLKSNIDPAFIRRFQVVDFK